MAVTFPRNCSFVFLIKASWRKDTALGSEYGNVTQNGLLLHGVQERMSEFIVQGPKFCIWIQTADTEIWRTATYSTKDIFVNNIKVHYTNMTSQALQEATSNVPG